MSLPRCSFAVFHCPTTAILKRRVRVGRCHITINTQPTRRRHGAEEKYLGNPLRECAESLETRKELHMRIIVPLAQAGLPT